MLSIVVVLVKDLQATSAIGLDIGLSCDLVCNTIVMETVNLAVKPLVIFVEDTFIYDALQKIDRYVETL